MDVATVQRVRGTLLGLAWGDALGCPVESWSKALIAEVYGDYRTLPEEYPLDAIPEQGGFRERLRLLGVHSDDTQQALALIQICLQPEGFQIERWTQCLVSGHRARAWRGTGQHFRRAVQNLEQGRPPLRSGSRSAGIGGAMRIAPLGAIYRDNLQELCRVVFEATYSTHADVRAVSLAFAVANACRLLVQGLGAEAVRRDLAAQVQHMEDFLAGHSDMRALDPTHVHAVSGAVDAALGRTWSGPEQLRTWLSAYARPHLDDPQARALGPNHPFALLGGIHALAMGLWPDRTPEALLTDTIQQGGDTDTVGAITGAILGARFGTDWIPSDRLEDAAALAAYADALAGQGLLEPLHSLLAREARLTALDQRFRTQHRQAP